MSNIQAIYALKSDGYTEQELLKWIQFHGLKPLKKAHYVGNSIRFRIKNPNPYLKYYTKVLPNKIHLVIET